MSELVKKYLIRSSGCILGPYSKKEVEELIKERSLSVNDEVIEPCSIAFYLQDHPDFSGFIQSMSKDRLVNFVTNLSGKISTSITRKTVKVGSEDTQTITKPLSQEEEGLSQVEDADFKFIEKKPQQQGKSIKYKTVKESEQITRRKVQVVVKRFWYFIIACSLFIAGLIIFKEVVSPYQKKKSLLERVQKEGINYYNSGNYEQSFKIFKEGSEKNILNVEEKKILLNLLIQKREIGKAEILLREIEGSLSQSDIYLIKGLIAFSENSYSQSEKFFLKVTNDDKDISFLNLILLKWVQKDYEEVLKGTEGMLLKGFERGIIFYLKNFSLIKMGAGKNQIKNFINNNLENSPEYYQELTLLLAYLYIEENNLDKIEQLVTNILDWDPYFYKEYNYDSLILVDALDWSFLFSYCEKLFEFNKDSHLLTALYGLCNLKVGSNAKGFQYIEKSRNQTPENDLTLSLFAYSLMQKGSSSKAEVLLNQVKNSSYKLPYILMARFFEQEEEWDFALTYWEKLLKIDPYHLSALGGMAFNNYKIKNYENMRMYKDRGLSAYSDYVRLLSLP